MEGGREVRKGGREGGREREGRREEGSERVRDDRCNEREVGLYRKQ